MQAVNPLIKFVRKLKTKYVNEKEAVSKGRQPQTDEKRLHSLLFRPLRMLITYYGNFRFSSGSCLE